MQTKVITIYCLCVEYLAAIGHRDDYQVTLTTAEMMTVALVAARFFKNCLESSRLFLSEHGYMRLMLSKSRLNRRLHAIPEGLWLGLFALLAESALVNVAVRAHSQTSRNDLQFDRGTDAQRHSRCNATRL